MARSIVKASILRYMTATVLAAAILAGTTMGVNASAQPADTIDGDRVPVESMYVSAEALNNDIQVLRSVPSTTNGKIGTIGYRMDDGTTAAIRATFDAYTRYNHQVSFILLDLGSGRTMYYNTGLKVYSASCIKGPYIISCLVAGNDATNDMYLAGHESDNDAYHRIRDQYGPQVFARWLRSAGVDASLSQYYYTHLTSMDLTRMWLSIYPYITGAESGSRSARQILQGSRNSAIDQVLGSTYTVYSKAGWISSNETADYNVYNVGGIVMDEHPYLMIITSTARGSATEAQPLVQALEAAHEVMIADLVTATSDTTGQPAGDAVAAAGNVEAAVGETAETTAGQMTENAATGTTTGLPGVTLPVNDAGAKDPVRSALTGQGQ